MISPLPAVAETPPTANDVARSETERIPRRVVIGAVVAFAGAVVALAAIKLNPWRGNTETTDSAFVDGHRVAVAPQVSGRVKEVLVDDNEAVSVGQILLRIDDADNAVKLEQSFAVRAQALGALAQARAQVAVIEAVARQAQAQIHVAEATARKTTNDLQRYQQLNDESVSRIALDAVETQNAVSAAQVDSAQQAAAGAAAQVTFAKTAVSTAEANLRAAEAQVALAKLNVSYCDVYAPTAGTVTRKAIEVGNYVQVGQPLLTLVSTDLFVTANFKETQLTGMHRGQPVEVTVDTFPSGHFHAQVDSVMSGTGSAFALLPPENATGNFVKVVQRVPVKITFHGVQPESLSRLALGMSVIATVDVSPRPPTAP